MAETVKFDPGIGDLVVDFNEYINNFYSNLMSLYSINQKRTKFKLYAQKIEKNIKNNIAFYWGCLLWAYHIYNSNIEEPKEITGNIFYNLTEEQKLQYDYKIQINFMENYFDSFERDINYYTGKKYQIPDTWKKILELYSEFLDKNQGFTNTKLTSDIVLPDKLKNMNLNINIESLINKSIYEKNLDILLNIDNLPS